MYKIYWDGEEAFETDDVDQIVVYMRGVKADYISDNLRDAERYADEFPEGYDHDAAAREWMDDVIEVIQVIKVQF